MVDHELLRVIVSQLNWCFVHRARVSHWAMSFEYWDRCKKLTHPVGARPLTVRWAGGIAIACIGRTVMGIPVIIQATEGAPRLVLKETPQ